MLVQPGMNSAYLNILIKRWLPAVVLMLVIYTMSSTPSDGLPNFGFLDLLVKKTGHMVGYALLALAFLRGLGGEGHRNILLAFLLTVLFAASDEIHQAFVPGRGAAWFDVLIDSSGAALGLWFWSKSEILQRFSKVETP